MRLRKVCMAASLALVGCKHPPASANGSGAPSASAAAPGGASAAYYAPARWRLASGDELDRTVLWVSQILIRHKESSGRVEPFLRGPFWAPDPPPPARTRDAALQMALDLSKRAAADPSSFAALAREASEDVTTRDQGGSLGAVRASQLPRRFLDALATLRPGEVSRPVATSLGYHVLLLREPPADAEVAGQHVVIRYTGTFLARPGQRGDRTRDEALAIAQDVARQARSRPEAFSALVDRYSDAEDAVQSGDLGVWSLRDPEYRPRAIEGLGRLAIGEVSQPIETNLGFEILKRTEVAPRPRYAMAAIELPYDPRAPADSPRSREAVLARARELAAQVDADPASFDGLRRQYCCVRSMAWTRGRGPLGLAPVLDAMSVGAIAKAPVESEGSFFIPMRLEPGDVPPSAPLHYQLPSPREPDLDAVIAEQAPPALAAQTRITSKEAIEALGLRDPTARQFSDLMEQLATSFADPSADHEARLARWHSAGDQLRSILGPDGFERYRAFLSAWVTHALLDKPI